MQTDKDLFDLMKEAYPLNPREDFVSVTSDQLRRAARKLERNRNMKRLSFAAASIAICAMAISWLLFYGGEDLIASKFKMLEEGKMSSSINKAEPSVYIYQSHNLESFLPETQVNDPSEAFHQTKNITLVGQRLSESLKKRGIQSIHDQTDIAAILKEKGLPFSKAYAVARESLLAALKSHPSVKMILDIHRDSKKRSDTTININGKDYPRIEIIVSRSSDHYEENYKFAKRLHDQLEAKYPGLSRGVTVKDDGPNHYNQDVLGRSLLLQIGGVENTLKEEYRTADALAEVLGDILKEEEAK
ncbi:stage II sporulation protein P [Anoxybacteroides tepidamans]|uniref:stage II sporulation protein P n=1 Tax=Anoxybacteroides tepidamans TaxID=265948 RepID=UPI000483D69C|nr:stage II sporulation protein P [Anoxybacillus tepidamans]